MTGLLRTRDRHEAKVGVAELFFDLVFVFAVTQLSHALLAHPTPLGALQTAMIFMGVWWVLIYTSWITNWLDPERTPVRLLLFALMAAGLFLAMAIPQAWSSRGLAFAGAYVTMQVGRSLFMLFAVRRHSPSNFRNFIRITIWLAGSGLVWLAGGLADPQQRPLWWALALAIEYAGPALRFALPGLGRSASQDWDIDGGHMAERCGLFVLIALGESILITGATTAGLGWTTPLLAAFASAFLGSIAMWWIYFNIGADRAGRLIARSADPGRMARLNYNYLHLPIIAGIIVSAAANELLLDHPLGHAAATTAGGLVLGPTLYLLGNLLFKRATGGWWPLSHLGGLAALTGLAASAPRLPPLAIGTIASAILLVVAIWETRSLRNAGDRL